MLGFYSLGYYLAITRGHLRVVRAGVTDPDLDRHLPGEVPEGRGRSATLRGTFRSELGRWLRSHQFLR
jgi:hypothetical protein